MIAVIDCCGSNISSVKYALERVNEEAVFTSNDLIIKSADKVLLPGVGSAGHAMQKLKDKGLVELIRGIEKPVLGICLGMQLLFDSSEEDSAECLGIIPGQIKRFPILEGITIPHMGWNQIHGSGTNEAIMYQVEQKYVYFVHSYYAELGDYTVAKTKHGIEFSSIVQKNNFYGMQFHPEKSGDVGDQLLSNFINL
jgi:glutamine amidotransferase